ncbi:MAG: GIY-YIG nuclease family protein [Patescibacteria group bacterium]
MNYFVYILECADKTLYTGTTNDLEKRILTHNTSKTGAKYTRSRRPVALKYFEDCGTKGAALKREAVIKKLTKAGKQKLINTLSK